MTRAIKRAMPAILIAVSALVLFTSVGYAAGEAGVGANGQWRYVLENGAATITGYVAEPEGDLSIPAELDGYAVTALGENAFADCAELVSVTIPSSVAAIGKRAFANCGRLTAIAIPSSVTFISWDAFSGCSGLTFTVRESSYAKDYAEMASRRYNVEPGVFVSGDYRYILSGGQATIINTNCRLT